MHNSCIRFLYNFGPNLSIGCDLFLTLLKIIDNLKSYRVPDMLSTNTIISKPLFPKIQWIVEVLNPSYSRKQSYATVSVNILYHLHRWY